MSELWSARLNYRKTLKADFSLFYRLYSDPRVMKYTFLDICNEVEAQNIFAEIYEEKVFTYYTVKEKQHNQFIGFIFCNTTLEHLQWGIVSIGYILDPDAWGKWYATEMAEAMMNFLFKKWKIHKVEANGHAQNLASEKVLIKLWMKKEWVARKARNKNNQWWDEFLYGILREEWEKLQP